MFSLLVLMVLAQPERDAAGPGGSPPEQALASIDSKGKLTIVAVNCACQNQNQTVVVQGAKEKVKVTSLTVTTFELSAKIVEGFTVDGKPIAAAKLAEMLAKERTVLVAIDGKKVDPFYLQLYKEGTIVLVPPPNTLNFAQGGAAYIAPAPMPPMIGPGVPQRLPPVPDRQP